MLIKEAAENLYKKNEITLEEYKTLQNCSDELEKGASFESLMSGARAAIPGVAVGTGAALAGLELYKLIKRHADISNAYNTMQEKVPSLTEYPQDKIKDYFEVIKTFSPKSASNPLVAGALVHKMLEFGGVDHKLVQDLNSMENTQPGLFYELAKSGLGGMVKNQGGDNE